MKAKAMDRQQAVQLHEMNGKDYIQIYTNETKGVDVYEMGEEKVETPYYEYDFAEIIVPHGTLDIEAVKKNPEAYLDYKPVGDPTIKDLSEALNALQEVVLGGVE